MSEGNIPAIGDRLLSPGVGTRGQAHHANHMVQFYMDDASFLDSLSWTIAAALTAGDTVIVIATRTHREGIARRLNKRGPEISGAIETARYISMDVHETLSKFMLEGWPDETRFNEVLGSVIEQAKSAALGDTSHVLVFGEMVAVLWAEGKPGSTLRVEELWNRLAEKHSFSLRCAYPIKSFDREEHGEPFLKICAEHSEVIPAENYSALSDDQARIRNATYLQHKAQALDTEKASREQTQSLLATREVELADLLENALDGIQQTGPDRRILRANKALLALLGYTTEEYVGHHFAEFYIDKRAAAEFWTRLMRCEDIYDFDSDLKCKDGSVKHVLIHSNGLWKDGNLIHTRSFIRDVTDCKLMEEALKLAQEELETRVSERTDDLNQKNLQILDQAETLELTNRGLRKLTAHLLQVQDEERRRIARDLHDSTGQSLALLSMNLSELRIDAIKSHVNLAEGLAENIRMVRQISTDLRTFSYLLHPPLLDEMGLEPALRWLADGFAQKSGIKVELELPEPKRKRLPRNLEMAIFRMVQECLTNIHLHAESLTAAISLSQSSEKVTLEIKDKGKGIPAEELSKIASSGLAGLGLRGMRERVKDFQGDMEIVPLEKGTQIKVVIPLISAGM